MDETGKTWGKEEELRLTAEQYEDVIWEIVGRVSWDWGERSSILF